MNKIKLFLGGHINKQNAQNLNCNALSRYLNKDKYDIYTMSRTDGNIDIVEIENFATIFKYNHKLKFLKSWNYIKALYFCDILYLPRRDGLSLVLFFNKFFKKKIFLTIEALFDQQTIKGRSVDKVVNTINNVQYVYSITRYMKDINKNSVNLNSLDSILYLGVDLSTITVKKEISKVLKNIIFIGNDMQRKRVDEYLKLSKLYPNLIFHIVGTPNSLDINQINKEYKNVTVHGSKTPIELNKILQIMDLHILTSKSEGCPKVVFETAAVGIPSIVYGSYGAKEWIDNDENGFIINNFDELVNKINILNTDSSLLYNSSKNAIKLSEKFSWSNMIKSWEYEIDRIASD
ncbi:MAG: glycosyltransferase family 4 protein [Campylobacterota bacterium]|nr:glycosyltransferase family 4 protein [Campylobacterota bacterium]